MSIFSGLEKIVETDYPLSKHTWFGLGGRADYFLRPQNPDQLKTMVQRCNENNIAMHVLGFGSNLLISDKGVRGAVIKLGGAEFTQTKFDGEWLTAGSGADLGELIFSCARKGLSGLEALTGIPGSVGGAIKMNAGGNFGDIGASVETVTLMDSEGNIFQKSKPELIFDYRRTNIIAKFILGARIKLTGADSEQVLRTIQEVWIYKKNTQPLSMKNSGCIFKNPRQLSAGALIDRAGLKDLQVGGAKVSQKHANFIVAGKNCKSSDVVRLIDLIRERVKEQFDIDLELELEIWR